MTKTDAQYETRSRQDPLWFRVLQAAVVVMALPLIIPVELFYRAAYPEYRWSKYPATMQALGRVTVDE